MPAAPTQLAAALAARRRHRAALLAAEVERLGRSAGFLLRVAEGTGGCGVVFCDLPAIPLEPVGEFLLT
jgi:hypothetical protein